jgi:hypothetical protein
MRVNSSSSAARQRGAWRRPKFIMVAIIPNSAVFFNIARKNGQWRRAHPGSHPVAALEQVRPQQPAQLPLDIAA